MNRREDVEEAWWQMSEYTISASLWSLSPLKRQACYWYATIGNEDPARPYEAFILEAICPYPIDDHQIEVAHKIAKKLGLFDLVDCIRISTQEYEDTFSC